MTTSPESSANEPIQPDNLPPPCPPVAETRTEHITPYDDLLARNQALETSNKALKSQITTLQSKNEYWTRLYTYVEKGIAIKITELTNLQEENNQLKTKNTELSNTVDELREKMVKLPASQALLKRVQQLEDQVRARDLVIELLKKDEAERKEREFQEKLEVHRQQMEYQLGIGIGPALPPVVTPKVPVPRNTSSERKKPARPQKKRKRSTTDTNANRVDSDDTMPDPKRNRRGGVSCRNGDGSTGSTEVEEMDLEQEFNDAFEELFDDSS